MSNPKIGDMVQVRWPGLEGKKDGAFGGEVLEVDLETGRAKIAVRQAGRVTEIRIVQAAVIGPDGQIATPAKFGQVDVPAIDGYVTVPFSDLAA